MMDMPRLKGVTYLEPGTPVYVEDLEAWEKQAGVKVQPGDAVFIRTGRWVRRAHRGPRQGGRLATGPAPPRLPRCNQPASPFPGPERPSIAVPSRPRLPPPDT